MPLVVVARHLQRLHRLQAGLPYRRLQILAIARVNQK